MTVEEALKRLEDQKLYISWLCQGESGKWICTVRRNSDLPFIKTRVHTAYVRRGKGLTMAAAILDAASPQYEDLGI